MLLHELEMWVEWIGNTEETLFGSGVDHYDSDCKEGSERSPEDH